MRSFCSGKTIYLEQNGARKGFVSLKTFSRNQMPKAEGFVPRERAFGTKSSRVSPFPEGRDFRERVTCT